MIIDTLGLFFHMQCFKVLHCLLCMCSLIRKLYFILHHTQAAFGFCIKVTKMFSQASIVYHNYLQGSMHT